MKGCVQIYEVVDGQETLICEESNLIVDGAAETIVDMLTTPSSVGVADRVLDCSNYVIQGVSFGKSLSGYLNNAHKYKKHNLIASSWNAPSGYGASSFQSSTQSPFAQGPTFYFQSEDTSGGYVEWGPDRFDNDYFVSVSGLPKIFSFQFSPALFYFPAYSDTSSSYMTVQLSDAGQLYSYTIRMRHPQYTVSANGEVPGEVLEIMTDDTVGNYTYLKKLSNRWYEMACVIPGDSHSANSDTLIRIYPASLSSYPGDTWTQNQRGGVRVADPMFSIGSVPTNYYVQGTDVFTSSVDISSFPVIASSVMNVETVGILSLSDAGTITSSLSSYDVIASLPDAPTPADTKLQRDCVTSYESCTYLDLPDGQNLNFAAYVGDSNYSLVDYVDGFSATQDLKDLPLQKDAMFLGCYQLSGGSTVGVISGLDAGAFADPLASSAFDGAGSFNSEANASMDISGYARMYYPNVGETIGGVSKCQLDLESDFSSTGEVRYKIQIDSDERKVINHYGGIFEVGMHSLDYRNMLRGGIINGSASVNKHPRDGDDMIFRLFAKKSFLFDITHIGDYGTTPGTLEDRDLNIYWTIDFS